MPCRSQRSIGHRQLVSIQFSLSLSICLRHLPPAVLESCCPHFWLQISSPSIPWSPSSSVPFSASQAPTYLADHCIPVSEIAGRQHLRSTRRQQLNVPRVRRDIGSCAFASAGLTVWNSLPDNLRDSTVGPDQFQRELKTHLFACLLNTSSTVR